MADVPVVRFPALTQFLYGALSNNNGMPYAEVVDIDLPEEIALAANNDLASTWGPDMWFDAGAEWDEGAEEYCGKPYPESLFEIEMEIY